MKKKWLFLILIFLAAALSAGAQSTGVITITVTNADANITVDRPCNRVLVRENSATPTAVFSITLSGTTTAQSFPAGTQYAIISPGGSNWPTGTIIGTIVATTAGPFTFTGTETIGQGSQTVNNSAASGSSGGMVYPSAGVANSTGSAWGSSYAVGAAANDLVELDSSGRLPAVNGSQLTGISSGPPFLNTKRFMYLLCGGSTNNQIGDNNWTLPGGPSYVASTSTTSSYCQEAGTTGPGVSNGGSGVIRMGRNLNMQTRFSLASITLMRFWFCFGPNGSCASSTSDAPTATGYGFRYSTVVPDTDFMCFANSAGTITTADSGVAVNTNEHTLEVDVNDTTHVATYYVDGTLDCTISTNVSSTDSQAGPMLIVYPTTGVAHTINESWIYLQADR